MASARSMLRAVAQASNSPGDVLRRVNDPLTTDIPQNMFVTCFYATLDPKSGSLTYANAGHDLPYLRRRDGGCKELRACYELGRKSHRNADFTVGLVPSRSLFPAFLSRF
jgi:serine phosphatase RsbU (regulator of sigma subunit)